MDKMSDKAREKKIINALKNLEDEYRISLNDKTNKISLSGALTLAGSAILSVAQLIPSTYLIFTSIIGVGLLGYGMKKQKDTYNENMYNIAYKSSKTIDMFNIIDLFKSEDKLLNDGIKINDDKIRYYLMSVVENNAEFLQGKCGRRSLKKRNDKLRKEMIESENQK